MTRHTQEGDSIAGEKITFECREYKITGLVQLTGQHKGTGGYLKSATCIIERRFRAIPAKESRK